MNQGKLKVVKQEMAKVNVDILRISELKWTGMGEFNSDDHLIKAMVFPVVIYGCESWTVKKAAGRKINAFELWCWRRLLRVLGLQGDPTSQF